MDGTQSARYLHLRQRYLSETGLTTEESAEYGTLVLQRTGYLEDSLIKANEQITLLGQQLAQLQQKPSADEHVAGPSCTITPSSDEEFQPANNKRANKRAKTTHKQSNSATISTENQFQVLTPTEMNTESTDNPLPVNEKRERTPPPVFLCSITKWTITANLIQAEKINIKSSRFTNDAIRLQPTRPDDYRKLIKLQKTTYFTLSNYQKRNLSKWSSAAYPLQSKPTK